MKYLMAEYQRLINELRMLRPDLEEETIVKEVQRLASSSCDTVHDWLGSCITSAMKAKKMPWENE